MCSMVIELRAEVNHFYLKRGAYVCSVRNNNRFAACLFGNGISFDFASPTVLSTFGAVEVAAPLDIPNHSIVAGHEHSQ